MRAVAESRHALPDWAEAVLDALLGSGVLRADALDGLTGTQLLAVARLAVRHALDGFELPDARELRRPSRKAA